MRVLVTRPEPSAARTAERLCKLGHEAVRMPLFETVITATIADLPPVAGIGGLIATSARAVLMFETADVIETGLRDVPIHAVGSATAQAATNSGFRDVRDGGGTAQALSKTLSDAWKCGPSETGSTGSDGNRTSLVYLAGVPRTPVIEAALAAENIGHSVIECYKMTEISYSTDFLKSNILSPAPDVILFYSAGAARRFSALADANGFGKALDSTRFLCLSSAIAVELHPEWQDRMIVAARPDEDSLIASLAELE